MVADVAQLKSFVLQLRPLSAEAHVPQQSSACSPIIFSSYSSYRRFIPRLKLTQEAELPYSNLASWAKWVWLFPETLNQPLKPVSKPWLTEWDQMITLNPQYWMHSFVEFMMPQCKDLIKSCEGGVGLTRPDLGPVEHVFANDWSWAGQPGPHAYHLIFAWRH